LNKLKVIIYDQWQAYSEEDLSSVNQYIKSSLDNLHLLIVEDDKLNQLVTSMMIKNFGWTCDIANDGIEALETFSPDLHQCILMDIEMPRMDGYACTTELRKRFGNDIPIIALSAYNESKESVIYESKGLDNYLLKPVKKDVLYLKIKQAMLTINQ